MLRTMDESLTVGGNLNLFYASVMLISKLAKTAKHKSCFSVLMSYFL